MNAGGVPNTCKSSGKAFTVYLTEPGLSQTFRLENLRKSFNFKKNDDLAPNLHLLQMRARSNEV